MIRPRRRTPTSPRERIQLVSSMGRALRNRASVQRATSSPAALCWNQARSLLVSWTPRDNRGRRRVIIGCILLSCIVWILPFLKTRRVDHLMTYLVMARVFPMQTKKLGQLGVNLPQTEIDYANNINTHAAIREVLLVREKRAKLLQDLENNALQCSTSCFFPKVVLTPNVAGWSPLRPSDLLRFNLTLIRFDEIEMKQTVHQAVLALQDYFSEDGLTLTPLRTLFYKLSSLDRIHLWALLATFLYGGMFVGNVAETEPAKESFIPTIAKAAETNPTSVHVLCNSNESSVAMKSVAILASAPRSRVVACLLRTISGWEGGSLPLEKGGLLKFLGDALNTGNLMRSSGWFKAKILGGSESECRIPVVQDWTTTALSDSFRHDAEHVLFFYSSQHILTGEEKPLPRVEIRPSKESNVIEWTRSTKVRLQQILRMNGSEPGWVCNRCLNWAFMGTFKKCASVCPVKYKETICTPSDRKTTVAFDVVVSRNVTHIPRIIHQTWFDDITPDRYPQLSRLQASWRSSGWDYRFYSDEDARAYIVDNYPEHFLETFDILVHGAFKADLFRYLVLLKDGGIYADVDVMLETDLDNFVQDGMSFFAPRDVPCEYADEAFCLWNGILGSSAGNPILIRAVERLVNLIQDRADVYDFEREVCLEEGSSFPLWKIRAQPLLFLTGPCGLGLAMNQALGRPSLSTLPIGYVAGRDEQSDFGDTIVLVGDKYDLGQFRISDIDRNMIFASTDLPGVSTSARTPLHMTNADRYLGNLRQPQQHYSASKKGVAIWGSANVYKDDLVSNIVIRLLPKHEN